jgi:hypothetical protein
MGALANPVGTGSKALHALRAPLLAKLATKIDDAPAIVQASIAGMNQGALNSAGASEADNLNDLIAQTLTGAGTGAAAGAAFGTAAHGVRRASQILRDRAPESSKRVAYEHVDSMLKRAGITPEQAALKMDQARRAGNDAMVMDLSPGLQAQAGYLARQPNVPSSNKLIARGDDRINDRSELFEAEVRRGIRPRSGQDADAAKAGIRTAQKAQGAATYDEVLDKPFVWNDELETFVRTAPPATRATMRDAIKLVENERVDPVSLGIKFDAEGNMAFDRVPSMRVFDYMKRAFDQNIGRALREGDRNLARVLSGELRTLKAGIAKSNPEYKDVLARQHDFFQQTEAVDLGLSVVNRLRTEPKVVLRELRALPEDKVDLARTGIVEAIIGLRNNKADPVKFLRSAMRTPTQRKVLEFAFNGRGNLARFERWMNRELRATRSDSLTAPGRQSATHLFEEAGESLKENLGGIAMNAVRGFAFGGPAGMSAAGARSLHDLRMNPSTGAMDEIAKILMSRGIELPKQVEASQKFAQRRQKSNRKAAIAAAKTGQQLFTGYTGG